MLMTTFYHQVSVDPVLLINIDTHLLRSIRAHLMHCQLTPFDQWSGYGSSVRIVNMLAHFGELWKGDGVLLHQMTRVASDDYRFIN